VLGLWGLYSFWEQAKLLLSKQSGWWWCWYGCGNDDTVIDTAIAVNNIFTLPPFLQMLQSCKHCYKNIEHHDCTVVPGDKKSYILYYKNGYKRIISDDRLSIQSTLHRTELTLLWSSQHNIIWYALPKLRENLIPPYSEQK
jgi:hypothetical protein